VVQDALNEAFQNNSEVRVIINLNEIPHGLPKHERQTALRNVQLNVSQQAGTGLRITHAFTHVPAIAGTLSREGLEIVRHLNGVQYVQLDERGGGALAQAVPSTGADKVRTALGIRGKGVRVAVLDSGASTTHPAIADSIVAQHCFTSSGCPPNDTNEGTSAEDDENHGSNVTGIITSNGTGGLSFGYAPDSEIVAVKVLDRGGRGWVSDWVSGLDWVYDNLGDLKVRIINMSLDTDAMYASAAACDAAQPALASAAAQLTIAGVTLFASSGNAGSTQTMSAPACNTGFIAVGATYDASLGKQPEAADTYQALFGSPWPDCSDTTTSTSTVTCFTNTGGKRLDLLAPGAILTSAGNGTSNTNYRGTSQASPSVAGVAALMLECNPALQPATILDILKATGQSVTDARSGNAFPLIRAEAAVRQACPADAGGTSSTGGGTGLGGTTRGGASSTTGGAHAGSGGQPPVTSTAGGTSAAGGGTASGSTLGEGGSAFSTGGSRTGGTTSVPTSGFGAATGGHIAAGGTLASSGGQPITTGSGTYVTSTGTGSATGGRTNGTSTTGDEYARVGGQASTSNSGSGGRQSGGTNSASDTTTIGTASPQGNSTETKASCSCRAAGSSRRNAFSQACLLLMLGVHLIRRRGHRSK
jgi:hypothetical protein